MTDSDHQVNMSVPLEQKFFPPDTEADKQVKFIDHEQHLDGKVTAINKNDASCYENAPVMEITPEDFDFFMTVFDNYETDKAKRAASQKKYFESNRKSYYERQKKWRDGHKVDLNRKRRVLPAHQSSSEGLSAWRTRGSD